MTGDEHGAPDGFAAETTAAFQDEAGVRAGDGALALRLAGDLSEAWATGQIGEGPPAARAAASVAGGVLSPLDDEEAREHTVETLPGMTDDDGDALQDAFVWAFHGRSKTRSDDVARAHRLADQLSAGGELAPARPARRDTRRLAPFFLAMALAVVGGAAATAAVRQWRLASQPAEETPKTPARPKTVWSPPEVSPLPEGPTPAEEPRAEEKISLLRTPAPRVDPGREAQTLFRRANVSLQNGQRAKALREFELLQRRFPRSTEAHVSRFKTAEIFLADKLPTRALAAWDAYVKAVPDGPLVEEALYRRARVLQALGNKDAALGAWHRLLQRFPRTLYGDEARRNLDIQP